MQDTYRILTEDEVTRLILALGRGQESFKDYDVEVVLDWAHKVKVDSGILNLALKHEVVLSVKDGEVYVKLPTEKDDVFKNPSIS